jgi:hypothetical protein
VSVLRDLAEFEDRAPRGDFFDPETVRGAPAVRAAAQRVRFAGSLSRLADRAHVVARMMAAVTRVDAEVNRFRAQWTVQESALAAAVDGQREQLARDRAEAEPAFERFGRAFRQVTTVADHTAIHNAFGDARAHIAVRELSTRIGTLEDAFADAAYRDGRKEANRVRFQEQTLLQLEAERLKIEDAPRRRTSEAALLEAYEAHIAVFQAAAAGSEAAEAAAERLRAVPRAAERIGAARRRSRAGWGRLMESCRP